MKSVNVDAAPGCFAGIVPVALLCYTLWCVFGEGGPCFWAEWFIKWGLTGG